MSIGHKGMEVAAKTLALTAADLLADQTLRIAAREEFLDARGDGFEYHPLLGERDPPLDYRLAE
jgi:aminobenzoyl-glutamate utilization protein B